jgi:hypothetical protein
MSAPWTTACDVLLCPPMRALMAVGIVQIAWLASCGSRDPKASCGDRPCASQETRFYYTDGAWGPAIDLVVVVDDSPSMATKQARVLQRLEGAFDTVFSHWPGGYDLEMRVISSTPPGAGAVPGCAAPSVTTCPTATAIPLEWNRICGAGPSFQGSPAAALACAARFPPRGCGVEQPLAALEASLTSGHPLRPQASLFIVIITDEDDCSFEAPPFTIDPTLAAADSPELSVRCQEADAAGTLTPLEHYVGLLGALEPVRTFVSVLAGFDAAPGAPRACGNAPPEALPAPRLRRFVEAFGARGSANPFCEEDWAPALSLLGQQWAVKLGTHCLPGPLRDFGGASSSAEPDCVVSEAPGSAGPTHTLPSCRLAGPPCWRAVANEGCQQSGYALEVDRGGCEAPRGTWITLACATVPAPRSP